MTAALALAANLPDLLGTSPADLLPTADDERHDSSAAEARERADRLRAGIVSYAQMRQDIADAFACRDWLVLGYQHWAAYVEAEFGDQLARLGRSERREAIVDLRQQGMSTHQIASATGMPQSTVSDAVRQLTGSGQLSQPERITGADGKDRPATRPTPKTPGPVEADAAPSAVPGTTPEPAGLPATTQAGSGPSPAPAADAPMPSREPDPQSAPKLRIVPDAEQVRADEQRDARALLSRAVDLLAPVNRKPGWVEVWLDQLGAYDDELSELVARAREAIAVLDELIEGCGR